MSVARGSQNAGHYYSNIVTPHEVAVSFVVAASDSGGLGVTSVKSNGWVRNVFMNTSATPGSNNGATNPNPAAGFVLIQLNNNFKVYLGCNYSFVPPVTGSAITTTVANTTYIISSVGSTTAAQWQAVGLPKGLTPTAGQSFVATASQAIGGTGAVKASGTSGIMSLEVVGDTNQQLNNSNIAANGGAYWHAKFLNTSGTATAPTAGTVINLRLIFDKSSVTVDGL